MTRALPALCLAALCISPVVSRAALVASDNAGNYSSWTSGQNQGSGFGAWSLSGGSSAGHFLSSSSGNAGGSSGNIDTDGKAWGLWAKDGQTANATRSFSAGALGVGQQFTIRMDNGYLANGSVGFALETSSGVSRFEFYYLAGGANSYTINVNGQTTATGIGWTGDGLDLVFSQGDNNSFSFDVTPAGGTLSQFTGLLSFSDISQVRLFNYNAGSGANYDAYFNSMSVVPEPTNVALAAFAVLLGLGQMWRCRRKFTR